MLLDKLMTQGTGRFHEPDFSLAKDISLKLIENKQSKTKIDISPNPDKVKFSQYMPISELLCYSIALEVPDTYIFISERTDRLKDIQLNEGKVNLMDNKYLTQREKIFSKILDELLDEYKQINVQEYSDAA